MTSLSLDPSNVETDCDFLLEVPDRSFLPEPCRTCPHMTDPGDLSVTPKQNASYWNPSSSLLHEDEKDSEQPPAKAGGFVLRTESPETRRLNDASYSPSIWKSSLGRGSK